MGNLFVRSSSLSTNTAVGCRQARGKRLQNGSPGGMSAGSVRNNATGEKPGNLRGIILRLSPTLFFFLFFFFQTWDLQPEKRPTFKEVKTKLGLLKNSTV